MRVFRSLLSAIAFLTFAFTAQAQTAALGRNYGLINPAQPTEAGKKVEVIEFFAYYCPHCNALDPVLANWVKEQGDNIIFKRVHTSANGEPMPQQKLFYALQAIGKEDEYHSKILLAIHFQHMHLDSDEQIIDFMAKQGMDKQKFTEIYNSFSVQSKVQRAIQMQNSYDVHNWPTIVLDGRLITSPPMAGADMASYNEETAQNMMLKVMDQLVAQLKKERDK